VPAIVSVGSDALFNFFTKGQPEAPHQRLSSLESGHRNWPWAAFPGSTGGVKLLMYVRHLYGHGVHNFIKRAVSVLLIVIPLLSLFRNRLWSISPIPRPRSKALLVWP